jgi:hypothetical protein
VVLEVFMRSIFLQMDLPIVVAKKLERRSGIFIGPIRTGADAAPAPGRKQRRALRSRDDAP